MYDFTEPFDPTLFDFSSVSWPNHETLYGSFFESHSIGSQHQSASFGLSDNMDFIESMAQLDLCMAQRMAISTINEVSGEGLDPSRLSCASEGEVNHNEKHSPSTSIAIYQQMPGSLPLSSGTSTPCIRPRGASRTHRSVPSRNRPASMDQVDEILLLLNRVKLCEGPNDLVCPVRGCRHMQLNGRIQDFRRHLRTHLKGREEIRCKGVAWEEFLLHRCLFPRISEDEQPYTVPGEDGLWTGGCLKTFSRADALKRHLKKTPCKTFNRSRDIVPGSQ